MGPDADGLEAADQTRTDRQREDGMAHEIAQRDDLGPRRSSLLAAQVAAAQGRLAMDRRLGRDSDPRVVALAARDAGASRRRARPA